MADSLPPEIRTEELFDGVRYVMPTRNLGPIKLVGAFGIVFGLMFIGVPLIGTVAVIVKGENLLFALFSVPFLLAGLLPLTFGTLVIWGHSEVELSDDTITAIETAGLIRWRRSRRTESLEKFQVAGAPQMEGSGSPQMQSTIMNLAAIMALFGAEKRLLIAPGYPRDLLLPLADALAAGIQEGGTPRSVESSAPAVEVIEGSLSGPKFGDRNEQPEDSTALLQEHANGITISFPAAGVWKGSKGLFFFSVIWCGFVGAITTVLVFADGSEELPVFLFLSLFWLVGIGMLLGALNMGRRQSVLAVLDGDLAVIRKGIFGTRRIKLRRDELAAIRPGPSGTHVNDQPIIELQIHPLAGKKIGLLSERDDREIEWAATVLRQALQVPDRMEKTNEASS